MSVRLRYAFLLLLVSVPAAGQPLPPPVKHALLIGASEYARPGDPSLSWWDLSSAPDVAAIRTVLIARFGFLDANVVPLTTRAQTSRASILAQLNALASRTHKGDIVYIHYSGHGMPVPDLNGDEADGFDETIVPTDYVSRADGSKNITDDEIGAWLEKLAARQPANVTLSFDSCFSGTQTRAGMHKVRGGDAPGGRRSLVAERGVSGLDVPQTAAPGVVVISAARNDQLADETLDDQRMPMGLLTYALVKELWAATPTTTYRDLFDGVLDTMGRRNPDQIPQLEGNIDQLLLSGAVAAPPPYTTTHFTSGRLMLDAGSLHGVTSGSVFVLYPRGARSFSPSSALTTARVTAVRATTAELAPDKPLPDDVLRQARAVETTHAVPASPPIRLDITALARVPAGTEIERRLHAMPGRDRLFRLTRSGEWDLKICPQSCPEAVPQGLAAATSGFTVIRQSGFVAATLEGADLEPKIGAVLDREMRRRAIADLARRDPRVDVQVRLVPATVRRNATGEIVGAIRTSAMPRTRGNQPVLSIGDYFMIELRHAGTLDAFVTVIDLSADGTIVPLWPHPSLGSRVQENKVAAPPDPLAADWILIPYPYVFQVGPPAGREVIKAIATDTPTNFSALVQSGQTAARGVDASTATTVGEALARAIDGVRGVPPQPSSPRPADTSVWSASAFTVFIEAAGQGAAAR